MRRQAFIALALSLALPCAAQEPAEAPAPTIPADAWFRYTYEQTLSEGRGQYEGYAESTSARARYDVVHVSETGGTIRARYGWTYSSPERTDSGTEDRTVWFRQESRHYAQRQTDVSDYDAQDGTQLAVWFWIPPNVAQGERVEILENTFTVMGETQIEIAGADRNAIVLAARTGGTRSDAYGNFDTTIEDRYWFDRETGMFLRERHDERDDGTLDGAFAAFRMVTIIEVIDASYAPATTPPPPEDYSPPPTNDYDDGDDPNPASRVIANVICFGGPLAVILGIIALVYFAKRKMRPPVVTAKGERFTVAGFTSGQLPPGLSTFLDPFLPHLAQVARASGQKVAMAQSDHGRFLGLGLGDRDTDVATIFASDSDVCEALRVELGQSEFFSEVRHPKLASVTRVGISAPSEAYNVYETFEVMALEAPPDELGYDSELVSPFKDDDRPGVVELLKSAYGVPPNRWLDASLAAGDLAWVAHVDRKVVGVALATLAGDQARLHTLTVAKDHQNRGVGTALYRARLRGLFDLGASRIVTECATWNIAALELARAHGFKNVGTMYVESARDVRVERKFVRR